MNFSDFLAEVEIKGRVEEWKSQSKEGYFYRFYEVSYETGPSIILHNFKILKETKCGHWIELSTRKKRFILKSARKRYALPTLKEAAESFLARKNRQYSIYFHRMQIAKAALDIMQSLLKEF